MNWYKGVASYHIKYFAIPQHIGVGLSHLLEDQGGLLLVHANGVVSVYSQVLLAHSMKVIFLRVITSIADANFADREYVNGGSFGLDFHSNRGFISG